MPIDTTGLYGWPDPDAIDAAAGALADQGKALREGIEDCETQWQGIFPHFSTDDTAVQQDVNTFFELVTAHGDVVEGACSLTKDIMGNFAEDIRTQQLFRNAALQRTAEHDRLVQAGEEPTGIYTAAEVQAYINQVVGTLNECAESRASELEAIDAGPLRRAARPG